MSQRSLAITCAIGALTVAGCGGGSKSSSSPSTTGRTSPTAAPQNLLRNADFAAGTKYWRAHITDGRSLRFAVDGAPKSLDVAGRHEARKAGLVEVQADRLPARSGASYTMSTTLRVQDPTANRGARQRVLWLDKSGKLLKTANGAVHPARRPGTIVLRDQFTAPAGAAAMIAAMGIVVQGYDRVAFGLTAPTLQAR